MSITVVSTPGGLMAMPTDYEYRMCNVHPAPFEKHNILELLKMQSRGETLTTDEKKRVLKHAEMMRVQRSKNKSNGRRK